MLYLAVPDAQITLTVADAAELVGVSPKQLRRWVEAGQFVRPLALPGHTRFARRDVEWFIEEARGSVREFNPLRRRDH